MKLSIITINYNNRDGLQKTVNSIRDFEWIVIDGGSTDGSKELIEKYADHFSYWVSEPDKGIYHAMNKGIEVAKGDYLQFVNSGDWLFDDTVLERCLAHDIDADVLYGDSMFVFEDHTERYCYPSPLKFKDLYCGFLGHASSFIKARLLKMEKYNENYRIVSDWEFWIKLALHNGKFYHLDDCVSYFNTEGISSTNASLRKQEREKVVFEQVPNILVEDVEYTKKLEALLDDNQVKDVLLLGRKKRLYHKIITACFKFIRIIDRF